MAGLGRRTHYRKHLTDSVLFDLPEPTPSERLAKVVATRGSNQFEVLLAAGGGDAAAAAASRTREPRLAILPTKFRKLVWVKRNDYVIVETGRSGDDDNDAGEGDDAKDDGGGGIRYIISHILYKDQVKHLKSIGMWPEGDPEFAGDAAEHQHRGTHSDRDHRDGSGGDGALEDASYSESEGEGESEDGDDGIVYENDEDLFVNTNRVSALKIDDSSSSSDNDD